MSFNDKKNMFQYEGISDYEKRRRAREAQGNADNANMAKMYTDTAKEMESGKWYGGNNNKNFVNSIGPMYGQDGYKGTAHDSWKTYGSSASDNVYDDDFTFDISESLDIKNNYGLSRDNYLTQKQQNEQSVDMYNKAMAEASMADQNAYINKIMAEKNAKSQSTALGRGGLGTNSSGQARLNTNYENSLNNIAKGTNDNIDNIYNQYMNAAKALESNSDSLEGMSMISYLEFLLNDMTQKFGNDTLTGHGSEVNPKDMFLGTDRKFLSMDTDGDGVVAEGEGMDNPFYGKTDNPWGAGGFTGETAEQKAKREAEGGEAPTLFNNYINQEREDELIAAVNKLFTDNDYFLSGSGKNKNDLIADIKSHGSNNNNIWDEYNKYAQEWDIKQPMSQATQVKAVERGAVANYVTNDGTQKTKSNYNLGKMTIDLGGLGKYKVEKDFFGDIKIYNKKLQKEQPDLINNKIEGDVIATDEGTMYILTNNKWRKLIK